MANTASIAGGSTSILSSSSLLSSSINSSSLSSISSSSSSSNPQQERQALRSALVQLFETEEILPADYLPELNIPPNTAILAFKSRYRERRLGSLSYGNDIINSSVLHDHAGSSSYVLPNDRLATTVIYSGFADPSILSSLNKNNPNDPTNTNENNNPNDISNNNGTTATNTVLQQREDHIQNLILTGSHTFMENYTNIPLTTITNNNNTITNTNSNSSSSSSTNITSN